MATNKPDPDKPTTFSSYLRPSLQEKMRKAAQDERKTMRVILEDCVMLKFPAAQKKGKA